MRVFVYGSLKRGFPNHRHLMTATFVGEAQTKPGFTLYDLGPFPGMVAGGTGSVRGEVFDVDAATLVALDKLESVPSFYDRATVPLADGSLAHAYLLRPRQIVGCPLIRSGSWRKK